MSTSDVLDFDGWLQVFFRQTGGFTALIVLVGIGGERVAAVSSTYVHLIGDDLRWTEFAALMTKSGRPWDGVVLFPETTDGHGPIPDMLARIRLRDVEARIAEDPIHINDGHFFDRWGRRMKIEETVPASLATRQ